MSIGPAVLITGFWTRRLDEEATAAGFAEVLKKPLKPRELITIVRRLISG